MNKLGGKGIPLSLLGQQTNAVTLQAGMSYIIPSGEWQVSPGPYSSLQNLDPVTGIWRTIGASSSSMGRRISSDGANYRLANLTGCVVGAVITSNACTGGVTGIGTTATTLAITATSGSSTWCPVVGGAISTTVVTGVTGATGVTADPVGAGYLYPPTAIISAPPPGGLQATAHVTGIPGTNALLATQVIIDNQGAGYALKSTGFAAATCTFINDPRDTVGHGATVRLGLTGTGLLTGLYPLNNGVPLTGVPTLTFATTSGSATAVMNFCVTTYTTGWSGAVWSTGLAGELLSVANGLAATVVWTNPLHEKGVTFPRPARITFAAGGPVVATSTVEDNGFGIQQVPTLVPVGFLAVAAGISGATAGAAVVGGVADTSWLQPV